MTDKTLERITYIKRIGKRKRYFSKILGHLSKSDGDRMKSWSSEGLDEVLNGMNSKNVIELVEDAYKIKPNHAKNLTCNKNFV